MAGRMKFKSFIMIVVEIICVVILGVFLSHIQKQVAIDRQQEDLEEKVHQIQTIVDEANASSEQETDSYDEVYAAKAATVAYIAKHSVSYEENEATLKDLAERMNVSNIVILDSEGKVKASAYTPRADFAYSRYNQLRDVFGTGENAEPFTVEFDDGAYRYYASKIDDDTEAVIEHSPEELTDLTESISSWKAILSKISVGLDGYAFAVSTQDYTFLYHPDEALIGTDALSKGISVSQLEDDSCGWMQIDGKKYYCGVAKVSSQNAYVICAVPESEILSGSRITVFMVLAVVFIVITLVTLYAIFLLNDKYRSEDGARRAGKIYFDKSIAGKVGSVTVIGLIAIVIVTYFMQTLFSISSHSVSNLQHREAVEKQLDENDEMIDILTERYNRRFLNKCLMASYILSDNSSLWTRENLAELSSVLDVNSIFIFDQEGAEVVSNSGIVNYAISDDEEDASYEFRRLLLGVDYVIQDAIQDEVTGDYYQYIGSPLYDKSGICNGFVQIRLKPERLTNALASTTLESVLSSVNPGVNGFAFAVSKAEDTLGEFVYYPDEKLIDRSAFDYGLKESQLRDDYNDYLTINGTRYYATSLEESDNIIYIVVPSSEMTGDRLPMTLVTGLASFICLAIIFLLSAFNIAETVGIKKKQSANDVVIDVVMPDGTVKRTDAAPSRWSDMTVRWRSKTPEGKLAAVCKLFVSILAILICLGVVFKERLFDSDSVFIYIISGKWEKGVNVFSIAACVMILCVIAVVVMILHEILHFLSKTMGARGATVCRLLNSLVKYVALIAALYYCFSQFGVDTATLLASAGILSLIIGLGAQKLVSDILAGLFIIFEGEFRVGDIVTIGDWRGTVLEIGVRTTKIENPGRDVKIFANSAVTGVINMTKSNSMADITVSIEYGESVDRMESILKEELPKLKDKIPAIVEGPYYKGITAISSTSVTVDIASYCSEGDRISVIRDMNREIKELIEAHDMKVK